jgi:hypothetical protein
VIDVDLARRLKDAGLAWHPARGDAFAVPDRDLDGEVFFVSDLVVELREVPEGPPILAFNGTTEWALDSLEAHEAVWLPSEAQLRDVLGDAFVGLERLPGEAGGWAVTVLGPDAAPERHVDLDPVAAHARAVLARLG